MTRRIITERKIVLEHYLNYLLDKVDLLKHPQILQFILSEDHNINMFLEQMKDSSESSFKRKKSSTSNLIRSRSSDNQIYFSSTLRVGNPYFSLNKDFSKLVDTFLENLEDEKEDMCSNIQDFWKAFKEVKWTNIKREDILKLLYGSAISKGLIYNCGRIKVNPLGSQEALKLLHKLVRYDFNPDCEYYIILLKMIRLEHILQLNIHLHLTLNKQGVTEACFQLLTHFINIEKGITPCSILMNKEIEARYEAWLKLQDEF